MSHPSNPEKSPGSPAVETLGNESSSFKILSGLQTHGIIQHQRQLRNAISIKSFYAGLYSKSHVAKILRVAKAHLAQDVSQCMLCLAKLVKEDHGWYLLGSECSEPLPRTSPDILREIRDEAMHVLDLRFPSRLSLCSR